MNKEELHIDRLEKALVRAAIALLKIQDGKHSLAMMKSFTLKPIEELVCVIEELEK